ncbi:restriction endonuclease subunit S, partial [Candidatus Bathyarchaeota archaeon]|nr:restriction endonuclease subunit S [Candidatus Bathyarchaeota archaeon]
FLQVQNIKEYEIDYNKVKFIPIEAHQKLKRSQLRPNDIIVTITGRVGTVAVVPSRIGECNLSKENARIRIRDEAVSPDYVAVYLNAGLGKKLLEKWNSGSTRSRTLIKNVRRIPIIIPNKDKQTQIVKKVKMLKHRKNKILAEAENLFEKAQKIQQDGYLCAYKLLGIKKQHPKPEKVLVLMKEALKDRLDVAFYSGANKYILQSEFPVKKMEELVEFSKENAIPEREPFKKFRYVQIQDIDSEYGRMASFTELLGKDAPSRARKVIHQGQILTGLSGSATGTANHSTAIVPLEFDGAMASTGFGVLKPYRDVDSFFAYFMLKSSYVLDEIKRRLTGATIPSITESCFGQIEIPLPPMGIQCKIVDILRDAIENSENAKTQAKALIEEAEELDREAENEFMESLSIEKG